MKQIIFSFSKFNINVSIIIFYFVGKKLRILRQIFETSSHYILSRNCHISNNSIAFLLFITLLPFSCYFSRKKFLQFFLIICTFQFFCHVSIPHLVAFFLLLILVASYIYLEIPFIPYIGVITMPFSFFYNF